jgi:hypothetical protein
LQAIKSLHQTTGSEFTFLHSFFRPGKKMKREKPKTTLDIKNSRYTTNFLSLPENGSISTNFTRPFTPKKVLPSLTPLNITLSPNIAPPAEILYEDKPEDSHDFIQRAWSTYSTLNDSHRNQLLKGLLTRSSAQQIEFICTCLNLKSLDSDSIGLVFLD